MTGISQYGVPPKVTAIKKHVYPWLDVAYPSLPGALLYAMGESDNNIAAGARELRIRGTRVTGTNDGDILYTALQDSDLLEIWHELPLTPSSALAVTLIDGVKLHVSLATDVNGKSTTTATVLKAAILGAGAAIVALFSPGIFSGGAGLVGRTLEYAPLHPNGLEGVTRDLYLRTAYGEALNVLGANYGAPRPERLAFTDARYRLFVQALAVQEKCNLASIEALLVALLGPRSGGWTVYETKKKTITVEYAVALLAESAGTASYLRASAVDSDVSWTGDYLRADATSDNQPRVCPSGGAPPLGEAANNSLYISDMSRPLYQDVLKLVRAAGVKVEFKHPTE